MYAIEMRAIVEAEMDRPVPPEVAALVDALCERYAHSATAILFYGSALRDKAVGDRLVDLYVLTQGYRLVHKNAIARFFNRLIPPNVYYIETATAAGAKVRAKYALVDQAQFRKLVSPRTSNPYFWARFCQPVAVPWTRDEQARRAVREALIAAPMTLATQIRPLIEGEPDSRTLWTEGFTQTYATELRAERQNRALDVYLANQERYDEVAAIIAPCLPPAPALATRDRALRLWARRRWLGKFWSVARLMKAAFTFDGGADYLAWKIERHSGERVALRPWQRRHPILATPTILWRLWRKGAIH